MRRAFMCILALFAMSCVAHAKQISLCDAQQKAKHGSMITTSGSIYEVNDDGFNIKDASSCSMIVWLKEKRVPTGCKVGRRATVTGEIEYDDIITDENGLIEATAKCGKKQ